MNMVIIFMVFIWNITGFDLCFPDIGKPFPQVSYDLQQFGKLHLWVELRYFCFLSAWSPQKLETLGF